MERYSAKLLFQFRVFGVGPTKMRLCEERMVCYKADTPKLAIQEARKIGNAATYSYRNADGNCVKFEFVGIIDMCGLGIECSDESEVWYDIYTRESPMKRKRVLTRTNSELLDRI